jgi:hypothetical protein
MVVAMVVCGLYALALASLWLEGVVSRRARERERRGFPVEATDAAAWCGEGI